MNMKSSLAAMVVAALLVIPASVRADDTTDTFNPKINAWAEGTILSLDADGKFSIRGVQRAYQTEYAKMLKDIHNKTAKLSGAERDQKEADIRRNYQDSLNKAAAKEPSKESDFTFRVNSKEGTLNVFDEMQHYNIAHDNPTAPAKLNETQRASMMSFKDLHVGDYVVVGYATGVINNDAFVVIKGNKLGATFSGDLKATGARGTPEAVSTPAPKSDKSKLDAQTEQMRQIRKRIVEDKNLSTAAHNVMLKVTDDGKAHISGTVRSDAEKTAVENHAAAIVGKDNVMSGLDINPK